MNFTCTFVLSFAVLFSTIAVAAEPPTTAIVISQDAIVACSKSGLRVHSVKTLECIRVIELALQSPHDLAFSSDGRMLAVGGGAAAVNGQTVIFDWPSGRAICTLGDHEDVVMAVRWLSAKVIASASLDGTIQIWDVADNKKLKTLVGHSRGILSLCVANDGELLVSAGIDLSLRVWNPHSAELVHSLTIHTQPINCLVTRPSQSSLPMIASASDDASVRFWQPTIGRMVRFVRLKSKPVDLAWLPDGSHVIAICKDGSVYRINPETVAASELTPGAELPVYTVGVLPNSQDVIFAAGSNLMRLAN